MISVSEQGARNLLNMLNTGTGMGSLSLRLFKNDLTPDAATVIGDFTEADFSGYAAATVTFASAVTSGGKGVLADSTVHDFTRAIGGTTNTVYGYYVLDVSGTHRLLWAERFLSSVTLATVGDKVSIGAQLEAWGEV